MCSPGAWRPPPAATTPKPFSGSATASSSARWPPRPHWGASSAPTRSQSGASRRRFKALNPNSSDDPCRYVDGEGQAQRRGFGDPPTPPPCMQAIRASDAELSNPVSKAPLGVAAIEFGPLPPLTVSFDSAPDGAVVTWRSKPRPDSLVDDSRRTMVHRAERALARPMLHPPRRSLRDNGDGATRAVSRPDSARGSLSGIGADPDACQDVGPTRAPPGANLSGTGRG